ncbi:MAG: hypothetical protein ACOYXB_06115 [Bacteroidota bacterium]
MKHYNVITTAILLISLLGSTAYTQQSFYAFPFENQHRLPSLEIYINMDQMAQTYQANGAVFSTEYSGPDEETAGQVSVSYRNNEQMVDAARFLENYAFEELMEYSGEKHGTVELKVTYFEDNSRMSAGSVLFFVTFGISSFVGCPIYRNVADLEVEAVFYDPEGNYLARYRGTGHAGTGQSLYRRTARKAHQKALIKAIEDLNNSIMGDPELEKKLGA